MNGDTCFLRCVSCKAMYQAMDGWSITTGKETVCWGRPKKKRKGNKGASIYEKEGPCDHLGPIERWDGEGWVGVEVAAA